MPLEPLLAALEQNIADDLNVERLAETGRLSRSQLYRDFYSLTGHTMSEYIRRRRLSNALALIKTSQLSLTDIACQCGFSSQQALHRAVRQTVGMTPLAYRNNETSLSKQRNLVFLPALHRPGAVPGVGQAGRHPRHAVPAVLPFTVQGHRGTGDGGVSRACVRLSRQNLWPQRAAARDEILLCAVYHAL